MTDEYQFCFYLLSPGPRPPFAEVVDHVYGADSNVDTEGDSYDRDTTEWTELYMQLRPPPEDLHRENPPVEVWMLGKGAKVMCVGSDDEAFAFRTAAYLAEQTGATMASEAPSA